MLKHASPQRSASSLTNSLPGGSLSRSDIPKGSIPSAAVPPPPPPTAAAPADSRPALPEVALRDSYSERSVDCESLIVSSSYALAEKEAGYQVGTWSGVAQANVRRGLSFSSRRAPDSISFRSVRSEGPPASHNAGVTSPPPKTSTSCSNMLKVVESEPLNTKGGDLASEQKSVIECSKGDMSSLKNLLRLPGVRGHAKIVEVSKGGVVLSPDSLSLNSSDSFFSANSGRTSSRSWSSNASSNSNATNTSTGSNSSTSEPASTTIKIFAKCLRSDIEYKTISVCSRASCKEVVSILLSKYRMRHRDPNLFYLTMEVTVRRWSGLPVRSLLVLEDSARPAQLALCRPPGDSRFALQMRRGGVIKVHDTVLMPGSQYKSLLVSDRTTAEEVVQLLLNCYNRRENKYYYAIHEVRRSPNYNDRVLLPEERPLEVKGKWPHDRQAEFVFVLRRNMSQALSLRRLSLRTTEVNRPQVPAHVSDGEKPLPSVEIVPVKGILKSSHPKPTAEENISVEDEAVIDCTGVTPRMTTINRKALPHCINISDTQANCAQNLALVPVTTSVSSGPSVTFSNTVSMNKCHQTDRLIYDSKIIDKSGNNSNVSSYNGNTGNFPPSVDLKLSLANSLNTVDSATNTEVKSWSNTSTQTVVSSTLRKPLSITHNKHNQQRNEAPPCLKSTQQPDKCLSKSDNFNSVVELPFYKNATTHSEDEQQQHQHICKHNCNHCFYI